MNEPEVLRRMLQAKSIAVVGLSPDATKPSHYVSRYMQASGCRIFPVNPAVTEVLGEQSYRSLLDLPDRPELVNVFRLPKAIPGIVEEMMAAGLDKMWVQQGIVNTEAAAFAEAHGITVVMDRCLMVEHRRQR